MSVRLYDYQLDAIDRMQTGCILCGGVGSGKSRTALAYYYIQEDGALEEDPSTKNTFLPMKKNPRDLYIITTARKRDTLEWEHEMCIFLMSTNPELNKYDNKVIVDSWNNIHKYQNVKNAFFIFDEQRVVGYGAWTRAFLKIVKENDWILLSATPGDTWMDYIPVFIANGFYKNKTEFIREHVVYSNYSKFPKVERFLNTGRLIRLRNRILINMDYSRPSIPHHESVYVDYDIDTYKFVMKNRWNIEKNEPIINASELCYELRKVVNNNVERIDVVKRILAEKHRVIIFYNFDYELDLIKSFDYGVDVAEWNGHKHQPIPEKDEWIYLVNYNAGAEGWNCIKTDTIIFFSQNYSYKTVAQSSGRIDRLNTPYKDLYYYHIKTRSGIDLAISKALARKKKFNETKFVNT